nr:IS66 family transposase [Parabacteroides pacaensis]
MKELKVTLKAEEYSCLQEEKRRLQERCALLEQESLERETQRKEAEDKLVSLLLEKSNLETENKLLRWELADLKRRCWSKSSEKRALPEDPAQLGICFDSPIDVEDPVKEEMKAEEKADRSEKKYNRFRKSFTKKITPHARGPIDPSLPREEIVIPMAEGIDLEGAVKMGEEVSEQYAIRPVRFYVIRIIRHKYRLRNGRIVTAPMPVMAHPRSNASESVLAHIATAKYYDHLPINRQLDIFEREGIHLSPSTVSNWMMATAQRLEPIYNELRELVKNSYYVMADETPHPVLENDRPGTLHRGYMWNFYLPQHKTPFFEYHQGRGETGVDTLVGGNVKVVQSDGFVVYDKFDTLKDRLHLCCWAHVRRKFVEAEGCDPPRAKTALEKIRILYRVEEQIKEEKLGAEAIVALRREKSYPVIRELEEWCRKEYEHTLAGSPIAKAMFYMYTRFEQLSGYVNDARFEIDNNPVERSLRPLTLNRKNVLFSGSHEAAHAAAIFFSLLGCCREHNVNPQQWLSSVLIKVQDQAFMLANDYSSLLPFNWINQ